MGYSRFSRSEEYFLVVTAVVIGNLVTLSTALTGLRLWLAWLLATMTISGIAPVCLSFFKQFE